MWYSTSHFFLKIIAWLFFLSGATFLPRKSYLQLRREAFDFRFRKAHHRTFDGLTVAEAGFPLGYRCYGKEPQKTESMSRCFGEKPFLLFLNFQETILVGFFGWFPFFSTSNWQRKLVGHSWSLSWFWLGQEGIWQGDFSFVQLADPQSLGQSFTALLLEEPALTHFLQYDNKQTFPNHLESGPYCISVFFFYCNFFLGILLSSGWACFMGTSPGKRRHVWSCPVLFGDANEARPQEKAMLSNELSDSFFSFQI